MKIAYVCFCPFHFEVFRSVYEHLGRHCVDIVITKADMDKEDRNIDDTIALLEKDDIPYVLHTKKKYDIIISCHIVSMGNLPRIFHSGTKYIRILYSTIGKNYTYSKNNEIYDLILTVGEYSKKRLSSYSKCISVGMPRYDNLFGGKYNKDKLERELGFDAHHPVLLYLPTWEDQCTIGKFGQFIVDISSKYTVIVKPHPLTYLCEKEKLTVFDIPQIELIREDCPIDKLIAIADLVITDYSSSIFEVAAARKPLLLLNLEKSELEKSKFYSTRDPEHNYRHIAVCVNDTADFLECIKKALVDSEPYPTLREQCTKHFFSCSDGSSTEKAVWAIKDFITNKKNEILFERYTKVRLFRTIVKRYYHKLRPNIGIWSFIRRLINKN